MFSTKLFVFVGIYVTQSMAWDNYPCPEGEVTDVCICGGICAYGQWCENNTCTGTSNRPTPSLEDLGKDEEIYDKCPAGKVVKICDCDVTLCLEGQFCVNGEICEAATNKCPQDEVLDPCLCGEEPCWPGQYCDRDNKCIGFSIEPQYW